MSNSGLVVNPLVVSKPTRRASNSMSFMGIVMFAGYRPCVVESVQRSFQMSNPGEIKMTPRFSIVTLGLLALNLAFATALVHALGISAARSSDDSIEIRDSDGKVRIRIGVDKDGTARIDTLDTKGTSRLSLSTDKAGTASFDINDVQGRPRIAAFTFADNESALQLLDTEGTLRISAMDFPDGQSWIRQFDKTGQLRITSGGPGLGNAATYFFDARGIPRMSIGTAPDGRTFFEQIDGKKVIRLSATTTIGGSAQLKVVADTPDDK